MLLLLRLEKFAILRWREFFWKIKKWSTSFEEVDGRPVLFYPDRKHFLVGRIIGPELLDRAVFP